MDKLWAPWRIKYVSQKKPKGCIFCHAYKEKKDTKNLVAYRSKHCFVILNLFPYNNGHLMVVPNRHVDSLERLTDSEILDINSTTKKMLIILKKSLKCQGFNIGMNIGKMAGAGIDKHIHSHIVPRWLGDTNFMPSIAKTKVISQSLKGLYALLKKGLNKK
ncbi:MAG: HIT domain-containing protein [Candidatus Omnitrophica bacterium]|nr:HIT domain-containing protein [Candidatus Omnitrophota bacterium]